jgi:competence protein ComEC
MPRVFYWILLFLLIAGNVSIYRAIFAPAVLTVRVLSVGKGDAILVQSPSGKSVLIDTGPDASILRALGGALPMWQRSIDAVILTSTKSSSVGGLPEVQSRYRVSTITKIGGADIPYGTSLTFEKSVVNIIAPATVTVSYGSSVFAISSSTPAGVYVSNGKGFK